ITPTTPSITPTTPSITPTTPSTVPSVEATPPASEEHPSTTAQSEQPSVAKMHTIHHHHYRGYTGAGPSLGSFDCSYFTWCVRISPPYAYTSRMAAIAIERDGLRRTSPPARGTALLTTPSAVNMPVPVHPPSASAIATRNALASPSQMPNT